MLAPVRVAQTNRQAGTSALQLETDLVRPIRPLRHESRSDGIVSDVIPFFVS